jgi:hypothetical protein
LILPVALVLFSRGRDILDLNYARSFRYEHLVVRRGLNTSSLRLNCLGRSLLLLSYLIVNGNQCAVARITVKVFVEVLQRSVGSLRVEEVDSRDESEIKAGEYYMPSAVFFMIDEWD